MDVLTSVNDQLTSDKEHLTAELTETRKLLETFKTKCNEQAKEMQSLETKY